MIDKFVKYKKFREYFSCDFENIFALIGMIILLVISYFLQVYEELSSYINVLNTFFCTIVGALIGTLALIFSGIVYWGSLFDKEYTNMLVKYTNDEDVIEKLYTSYIFLNFNIIVYIVATIMILFAINSPADKISRCLFFFFEGIYIYWFLFIIGYLVAIMRNCVVLIQAKGIYNGMEEKTLFDKANEIRIDIIFELLYRNMSKENTNTDLMNILKHRINMMDTSQDEKDKLAHYFEQYYQIGEKSNSHNF